MWAKRVWKLKMRPKVEVPPRSSCDPINHSKGSLAKFFLLSRKLLTGLIVAATVSLGEVIVCSAIWIGTITFFQWVTETVAENGSGDIKKKSQLANDEKSAINNHGKGLLETSAKTFAILAAKAIAKKKIQLMFAIMSSITAVMVLFLQLMCLFNLIEFENPSRLMGFLGLSQTTLIVSFGCSFYLFYFYKCAASAYLQAHHSLKHIWVYKWKIKKKKCSCISCQLKL